MSLLLTADDALQACRGLALKPEADEKDLGLWTAKCPVCALYSDKPTLAIRETQREKPAKLDCRNKCDPVEIAERLCAELGREPSAPSSDGLAVHTADLALSRPPEWAWADRIVLSALNLIVGVEGSGKGTLACWIFAKLTRGELPGNLYGIPSTVAIVGDEDGFGDVWTPRLHAAGAQLDRIKLIERGDGSLVELAADRERLADVVSAEDIRLLYLDQLTDNLGAAVDDWKAKPVREALAPARQLARELNCAVLGSLHPNKGGGSFRQLVSGSVAFNALSRSSLLLAEHPEDAERRILVRGKGNLSAEPDAVEFEIEGHKFEANGHKFNVPRAVAFTTSTLTSEDVLSRPAAPVPAGEARTDARELIATALADGEWHEAGPIIAECECAGSYKRAAQRAANDLGIEKERRGFPATSHWRLPRQEMTHCTSVADVATVTSVETAQIDRDDSEDTDDSGAVRHLSVTTGGDGAVLPVDLDLSPPAKPSLARGCECDKPILDDERICSKCGRIRPGNALTADCEAA
jgi:AAA domain-containing protein